jgi:hypothetical protein
MLQATMSANGMNCIEIKDPTPRVREIIKQAIACNLRGDPRYELGFKAGAFLQSDYEEWVLVEFWRPEYQPFIDPIKQVD